MKAYFTWSDEKNKELKANPDREVCFEDIVASIETGGLLDDLEHSNSDKYGHQRVYVVAFKDYVYAVPYVTTSDGVFLKTIFPSRKLKAIYLKGSDHE